MSTKIKNNTLLGVAIGLVIVPAILAFWKHYKHSASEGSNNGIELPPNRIFSAYRGKHKPHRRHVAQAAE